MCGVVAVVRAGREVAPCFGLSRQTKLLQHRGPDTAGVCGVDIGWGRVDLGMSRLKIVDQSDLGVPYRFPALGVTLAFNGEIYNWRRIRDECAEPGSWETACDAEAVAHAWRDMGPAMLDLFNGMFGLVLVDEDLGEVFIARDRAGQKPMYWARHGEALCFASEAKALPVELAETGCADLMAFEFDWGPWTPLRGVERLGAGTYIHLRAPGDLKDVSPKTWWSLPGAGPREGLGYCQAVDELEALIVDAVRVRLSDEVPTALQLSGGLDSAILYKAWERLDPAGAQAGTSYCMDFASDDIDNLSTAQLVDPDVVPVTTDSAELKEILPRVLYHLDTPATWSAVCLWKLAEAIHSDGSRIILSGEGSDELFGGYTRYRILWHLDRMVKDHLLESYRPTWSHLLGEPSDIVARLLNRAPDGGLHDYVRDLVVKFGVCLGRGGMPPTMVRMAMRTEFNTTMQVLLRMGDRMAAAWGLENRCPFLDHRILSFASGLPDEWLIRSSGSKWILRDVARRLEVPTDIIDETTKKGLAIPWAKWASELGISSDGTRGPWDRSGFSTLCNDVWQAEYLRKSTCIKSCNGC